MPLSLTFVQSAYDLAKSCLDPDVAPAEPDVAAILPTVSANELRETVDALTQFGPAAYTDKSALNRKARLIRNAFRDAGARVSFQNVETKLGNYKNVIGQFGSRNPQAPVIVVGAHYDTHPGALGANDNGSGVAVMMAFAKHAEQLAQQNPGVRIELVAYTLEECSFAQEGKTLPNGEPVPDMADMPHDETNGAHCGETHQGLLGSAEHAKSLKESGANVKGVIVLETIGQFHDEHGTQEYPDSPPLTGEHMKALCGDQGNYLSVLSDHRSGDLIKLVTSSIDQATSIDGRGVRGTRKDQPDLFRADHTSYLVDEEEGLNDGVEENQGYPAVFITDSANFRNARGERPSYHTAADTPDKINYEKLSEIVQGIYFAVNKLAGES